MFNKKLLLIIVIAVFLRMFMIESVPPAMYGDELTMVYDVYSILKTGFDQTGEFLPLTFRMGDHRPVGYGYFSLPFVFLFGTTALSIRALSVFSGVSLVILMYLLTKKLFDGKVALAAAFFMAVSPWDLNLSRGGFETHFALFLAVAGITAFIYARSNWLYLLSAICFGLSLNTYSTYKMSVPLVILIIFWFKLKSNFKFKDLIAFYLVMVFFAGIFFTQAIFRNSEARFLSLNIFTDPANQSTGYVNLLARNYLSNFSPEFLFLKGDKNPRHNMTESGVVYLVDFGLILFGIFYLIKNAYYKESIFIFGWILISPMATSLLSEAHALRSSFMLPPLIIFSALGSRALMRSKKMSIVGLIIITICIGIQFSYMMKHMLLVSPNKYSRFWSYPAKMAAEMAIKNTGNYDYILLSDRIDNIEFAYPVYAQINPKEVLLQNQHKQRLVEYEFRKYRNIFIGPIPDSAAQRFIDSLSGRVLYIGPAGDSKYLSVSSEIKGKDGAAALTIVSK